MRWRKAEVWDRLLAAVWSAFKGDIVMIGSTCIRGHQRGATGKKGSVINGMGRSRGGLTSKIHALVDAPSRYV